MRPPIRLIFIRHADELDALSPEIADGVICVAEDFANPFDAGFSMSAFRGLKELADRQGMSCFAAIEGIVYEADLPRLDEWLRVLRSVGCDGVFCFDETVGLRARAIAVDFHVIYHPITLVTHTAEADFYGSQGFYGVVASVDLSVAEAVRLASHASTKVGCLLGNVPMYVSKRRFLESTNNTIHHNHPLTLEEESRPGRCYPVAQNARGTMILRDAFVGLPTDASWRELPFEWLIGFRGAMSFEPYADQMRRLWGHVR